MPRSFRKPSPRLFRDILFTLAAVACASALRVLLEPVLYDRAAFTLFTLAVMVSAWIGGWRMGLLATVLASVVGVWLFIAPFYHPNIHDVADGVQTALFAGVGCGISLLAERLHRARIRAEQETRQSQALVAELKDTMANVRTLHGLLPICASCKKIRDDQGYWQQLEVYVRDHSEADFSHGLCPECARKYWDS